VCVEAGEARPWRRPEETDVEAAARFTTETRSRCVPGCAFEATPAPMKIQIARIGPPADRLGAILAPGSVPAVEVPVCEDFDPYLRPIGRARIDVDGAAEITFAPGVEIDVEGLEVDATIGIGFRVLEQHEEGGVRVLDKIEIMAVGINRTLIKRSAGD
jgi:hypothetical protein